MLSKQKNYQTVAPDYIHLMPLLYKNSLEGPGNKHLQEVTARESTALFKMSIWQDMLAVCTWQTDHGSLDCTTPPPPHKHTGSRWECCCRRDIAWDTAWLSAISWTFLLMVFCRQQAMHSSCVPGPFTDWNSASSAGNECSHRGTCTRIL